MLEPDTTVYILGPMTGKPNGNREAFAAAARVLRAKGLTVINPAELDQPGDASMTWAEYLARDLPYLCDESVAAVALPGWITSDGGQMELFACQLKGIPVYAYPSLEPLRARLVWTSSRALVAI